MRKSLSGALALFLSLGSVISFAQGAAKNPPQVSKAEQEKIDEAIKKGVEYLKEQFDKQNELDKSSFNHKLGGKMRVHELVTLTLLHAGLDEDDPVVAKLVKKLLEFPLDKTYHVALQAMVFQKLDPYKYQARIAQCAQFLVDNQAKNGQWGYGKELKDNPPPIIETGGQKPKEKERETKPANKIIIKKGKDAPESLDGDNSNSQYAALGLRACFDANVLIPADTIKKAKEWWEKSQVGTEGAWTYNYEGKPNQYPGYGSMTCGAIGAICIYDFMLSQNFKQNDHVKKGVPWLEKNFDVKPGPKVDGKTSSKDEESRHYYFLYALERCCILYETESVGTHNWYPEGANWLVGEQNKDGSWTDGREAITNTCFAILFLRRATKPLKIIETGK